MGEIIVIGAGIGGLCSAVRLLSKGNQVRILEKTSEPGGRVGSLHGVTEKDIFDLTASIIMTPKVYTDIFHEVGKNYRDYFEMSTLDVTYKVNYHDGSSMIFHKDIGKTLDMLEQYKEGLSIEYMEFLDKSYEKYRLSKDYFLDELLEDSKQLLKVNSLKSAMKICPFKCSKDYIDNIIHDDELKKFLLFQSMYIGVNPYENSSVYTLIPAITQIYGLGYIVGGMLSYIRALEKLVYDLGGSIEYRTEVSSIVIHKGKVQGVKTIDGEVRKCHGVICNCDYTYAVKELIDHRYIKDEHYNAENIDEKEYSCSVFMMYAGLDKFYKELQVHNIYICEHFKESLESAFKGKLAKEMNLYIYCPSAIDSTMRSSYKQCINVMVRVPNLKSKHIIWDENTINSMRENIIKSLKNIKGLKDIDRHIIFEDFLTPVHLRDKYNITYGSAFGLSHNLNQSMYLRPHIKSKSVEGLYFIGASTHPGNGVSVIIDGSKLVCDAVMDDENS